MILSIKKNSDFIGVNLWTLIFAIFIASIGLNVNSTAVIIGAMLISPLMGPMKKPLKNERLFSKNIKEKQEATSIGRFMSIHDNAVQDWRHLFKSKI